MIGSRLYDALKFTAQIFLPAVGSLYTGLAALYNWTNVDTVVGTIVVADTFLGVFVSYLKLKYDASDKKFDGEINVLKKADGKVVMDMALLKHENPEDIEGESQVLFRVNKREE